MNWLLRFRLFQLSTNALIFLSIGVVMCLTGKFIETAFLLVGFFWFRYAFEKTYHDKSFRVCVYLSIFILTFAILFMPNKNLSLLGCIVFALLIDFGAYKVKDYQDLLLDKNKPFNVNTCTQAELINRCREIGLSEENTSLAIEFFIKKTKQSVLADKLFINEKSVQIRKKRLKEKLNKI